MPRKAPRETIDWTIAIAQADETAEFACWWLMEAKPQVMWWRIKRYNANNGKFLRFKAMPRGGFQPRFKARSVERRALMVEMVKAGKPAPEVAAALGVTYEHLMYMMKQAREIDGADVWFRKPKPYAPEPAPAPVRVNPGCARCGLRGEHVCTDVRSYMYTGGSNLGCAIVEAGGLRDNAQRGRA